jgi:hypothetical protein
MDDLSFPTHGGKRQNAGRPAGKKEKEPRASKIAADEKAYAVLEFAQAKAKKESYQAHIAELEYLERKGKLVNADGVERAAFQFGRILQKNLVDVFPSRISMEIAGMTDPWEIEKFIREKMRIELASVSKLKPEEIEDDAGTE